jgi:N-methylhydantoinase A/acetophenone carboxylase
MAWRTVKEERYMKYNIDIDVGGIFTSGFLWGDGRMDWVKVETTPDDMSIGFAHCISELATRQNTEPTELLKETGIIRLSSTMGALLTRMNGPKVGLLVSSGYEQTLYDKKNSQNNVFDTLISPNMVIGISGSIDSTGNIAQHLNEEEVRKGVKQLLIQGARYLVVSLLNSSLNSALEEQVREIVEVDYPKHFLGSVPVMLSTETSLTRDNAYRTRAALLDTFIHRQMTRYFYKTDEDLRNTGYQKHLLVVHNSGGAARTAKTKAINTIGSSQTAALYGASYLSQVYGLPDIVIIDAGGTSTDVGLIINGKCTTEEESDIKGLPFVRLSLLETIAQGIGGNSIVSLSKKSKTITIGPDTVDNRTGPSCFDSGSNGPAVIDACLVLGYVNPDFFTGGNKKLNIVKAYDAINKKIASPLGMTVEQASLEIVRSTESTVNDSLKQLCTEKSIAMDKMTLFACGGLGGLICDGVSREAKIDRTYIAPFAAHFSAFGSSTIDVIHEYESTVMAVIRNSSGKYLFPDDQLNRIVEELIESGIRDMHGEEFSRDDIKFTLELEIGCRELDLTARVPFPRLYFKKREDIEFLIKEFEHAHPGINDEIVVEMLKLKATCTLPHPLLRTYQQADSDPEEALKGYRKVFWDKDYIESPIYDHEKLKHGNKVTGPAIVEGPYITILIPGDRQYSVDKLLFGIIEPIKKT